MSALVELQLVYTLLAPLLPPMRVDVVDVLVVAFAVAGLCQVWTAPNGRRARHKRGR